MPSRTTAVTPTPTPMPMAAPVLRPASSPEVLLTAVVGAGVEAEVDATDVDCVDEDEGEDVAVDDAVDVVWTTLMISAIS